MPNRILREGILTSERIDQLAWPAEVFYRRLMSVVDDFGRFHANPSLLRAACYPLRLDRVSNSDIDKWLTECVTAGLVRVYQVEGKSYVEVIDFKQQKRAEKSKFPDVPPDIPTPSKCVADAQHVHTNTKAVAESESYAKKDVTSGLPPDAPIVEKRNFREEAAQVLEFLNAKTKRNFEPFQKDGKPTASLQIIVDRLKSGVSLDDARSVVALMCRKWGTDEKMRDYLQPSTLFRASKFENYQSMLRKQT